MSNITFFGQAFAAPDGNYCDDDNSFNTLIPPALMVSGDLVVVDYMEDAASGAPANGGTDGQSWNALTSREDATSKVFRRWWAEFNGTWSANPTFVPAHPGDFQGRQMVMNVWRKATGANGAWVVDGADAATAFAAPGTPFDVSRSGVTNTTNKNALFLAFFGCRGGNPTWANQSGGSGWANPGGQAQVRNNADVSLSHLYLIATALNTASGTSTNRQSATGYAGWSGITGFSHPVASSIAPKYMYQQNLRASQ